MNLSWLQTFYIMSAILVLGIVIMAYPTISAKTRSKKK